MSSTVTKSELIDRIADKLKMPSAKVEQLVNTMFDAMVGALQRGEGIEIRGFGSFTVRHYKAYEGRNPRTGEPVHVAPKRLPFFKVGKDLRERINARFQAEQAERAGATRDGAPSAEPTAADGAVADEPRGPRW
ncbi:MAG: integration host factor subunit beta [Deltaproteobacteria bacterium]|nr:MAG: integration host factor subunit beta [Deltaproteobacteria bacterium]